MSFYILFGSCSLSSISYKQKKIPLVFQTYEYPKRYAQRSKFFSLRVALIEMEDSVSLVIITFPESVSVILNKRGLPQSGKNIWNLNFFPGQGKVRKFCGWSGKFTKDLECQWKVKEFENKWLWQADFRKFNYSFQEGKRCTFSWDSLSPSPSSFGATLTGKSLLPWGANSFLFRVTPKFEVIRLAQLN